MSEIPAKSQTPLMKIFMIGIGLVVACLCLGAAVGGGYFLAKGDIAIPFLGSTTTATFTSTPAFTPTFTPTITLTPTLTLTPTSTATSTPENTPTPAVTLSPSDLAGMVAVVQQGGSVPEAAEYQKSEPGPHLIILLDDKGELHDWNKHLRPEWVPNSLGSVELVGTISYFQETVATQKYTGCGQPGAIFVTRVRRNLRILLQEAKTGKTVSSETFPGSDPPGFPRSLHCGQTTLFGESVPYATLQEWLRPFIKP